MNPAPFLPVLAWLDAGAQYSAEAPGFDMDVFVSTPVGHCGTICCIAGAVVIMNPDEFNFEDQYDVWQVGHRLGMCRKNADELFMARQYRDDTYRCLTDIKPHHAARTLRGFIKNGYVDWQANE